MPVGIGNSSESQMDLDGTNMGDGLYLFTTKTCPNCNIAREYLKGISYNLVDAEENPNLAMEYKILQAPTLVEIKNGVVSKYPNASNIKKFVEEELIRL